jgi:chemotaxis protein histidine kinase CheA
MNELLNDFLNDAGQTLVELDIAVRRFEIALGDRGALASILRQFHTMKGICGFFGLTELEYVVHSGETVLSQVRDGAMAATPDTVRQTRAALDRMRAILDRLAKQTAAAIAPANFVLRNAPRQPIAQAWAGLPRLVRELAVRLDKKIELVRIGTRIELDGQVLALLRDPMIQIIRNSADHGIESPAERRAAGKPEAGRITVRAMRNGGAVRIDIEDDGRGLGLRQIRARAVDLGIATDIGLAAMTQAEIELLIFHPGLSTASAVGRISGRGVGMDVVRTNIERAGGRIEIASRSGKGFRFTLHLPPDARA